MPIPHSHILYVCMYVHQSSQKRFREVEWGSGGGGGGGYGRGNEIGKIMPFSLHKLLNDAFSLKKPYPG